MQLLPNGNKSRTDVLRPTDEALRDECAEARARRRPASRPGHPEDDARASFAGPFGPAVQGLGLAELLRRMHPSPRVADYIGSSLPAASRMIDGLVAKNLVGREAMLPRPPAGFAGADSAGPRGVFGVPRRRRSSSSASSLRGFRKEKRERHRSNAMAWGNFRQRCRQSGVRSRRQSTKNRS